MPSRNLVLAFHALWWTLGLLLCWYSVRTAVGAAHAPLSILAWAEAAAALLFLVPRTMRLGGAALLAIFALAFAIHAAHGEFASQLILYAAAVAFVVVHGVPPLPRHR